MVFSSILFLCVFLPAFLLVFSFLPRIKTLRQIVILFFSLFFYAWGEPRFTLILLATTLLDFFVVAQLDKQTVANKRKALLVVSLAINVGLLFYFKYFNFFVDNGNLIASWFGCGGWHMDRIVLPAGISFFIFESITYAVDVYRRAHPPLKNFWDYQMYIIFFPKLIAGPIVRYGDFAEQLQHHHQTDAYAERIVGFVRFCIGLGKKVLLANVMGAQADAIYALPADVVNTSIAWVGAVAYTFQIYFDFSGYSDMALGLARMMGIRLPENFNSPYIAQSITEFWRRWHITLGAWMKNYIYIPLGGNQVNTKRLYINLLLVFLISGLWHGASWNFVIWGAYHGLFLMVERWLCGRGFQSKIQALNIVYTFFVVVVGWVIFRNENLDRCVFFLQKMAAFDFSFSQVFFFKANFFPMLVFAVFFSFCTLLRVMELWQNHLFYGVWKASHQLIYVFMGLLLYALAVIYISNGGYNPFIYFKF